MSEESSRIKIADYEISLIFLREGLSRMRRLRDEEAAGRKIGLPDVLDRIKQIKTAIRHMSNELQDLKFDLNTYEKKEDQYESNA